jgi:HAD superfamily hydrolase (TIGR01509 family)
MSHQHFPTSIRAVLFDFDGTLRHNDPNAHEFFFDYAVELGAEDSEENRRESLRWAHGYWNNHGGIVTDSEKYGYDTPEFWLSYARQSLQSFNCPQEQVEELAPALNVHMADRYEPDHRIDPEIPDLIDALRGQGLAVAVVSNRNKPLTELMDTLGLTPYFDFAMAAGEVNAWKPDPEIFFHAMERTGTSPEETIYVGDNYYADILGSRNAGLIPVLIDPHQVFPDADCIVIKSLSRIPELLNGRTGTG